MVRGVHSTKPGCLKTGIYLTMLNSKFLLGVTALAVTSFGSSQPQSSTPTTDQILKTAGAKAKKEGKNVLVVFHASWCGWCHKFDKFWESPEISPLAKKSLETVHITILEDDKHKADMNEGGEKLYAKLGGGNGIPFMAILSPEGKLIINSNENNDPKKNTGYPGAPNEIAHFIKMLKMGAKKLSESDLKLVETTLTNAKQAQ